MDTEEEKKQQKREYMRNYMRVWKQNRYTLDPQSILRANRTSYILKKEKVTEEEKKKYGSYLETFVKTRKLINTLVTDRPDLISDIRTLLPAV